MFIPDEIQDDDELATEVGRAIAGLLRLPKARHGSGPPPRPLRYATNDGFKSDAGLARSVVNAVAEAIAKRDKEAQ